MQLRNSYYPETEDVLALAATGDWIERFTERFGVRLPEDYLLGCDLQYVFSKHSDARANTELVSMQRRRQPWVYTIGVGRISSTLYGTSAEVSGGLRWDILPKMGF